MNIRRVCVIVLLLTWTGSVWFGGIAASAAQSSTPERADQDGTSLQIGAHELQWTDEWQLNRESTNDSLATLLLNDSATGDFILLTFSPSKSPSDATMREIIDNFERSLTESNIGEVTPRAEGETEAGSVWRTMELNLQGIGLVMVVEVIPGEDGEYAIVTLTTTNSQLEESVERVRSEVLVDGEPGMFVDIDPSEVVPPPATPSIWPGND